MIKFYKNKIFLAGIITFVLLTGIVGSVNGNEVNIEPPVLVGRGVEWDVVLDFDESGGSFTYVVFGEASDANDGSPADVYDKALPPVPMTPYVRAWFDDGLSYPYDVLREDFRSFPDSYKVWDLFVVWAPVDSVSGSTVTVSWDTNEVDDSEYGAVGLYDASGSVLLKDMLVFGSYSFSCSALTPMNFKIICGSGGNAEPIVSSESPSDGSVDVVRPPVVLGAFVEDPDGDSMDVLIRWKDHDGVWVTLQSFIGVSDGTYGFTPAGDDWIWGDTVYVWSVNASDGTVSTNEQFVFTTMGSRYDVNNDGSVNFQDAGLCWVHRDSVVPYEALYDVNSDGTVNFQDAGLCWVNRD